MFSRKDDGTLKRSTDVVQPWSSDAEAAAAEAVVYTVCPQYTGNLYTCLFLASRR